MRRYFLGLLAAVCMAFAVPAYATVNSSTNRTLVLGNGAQTQFTFNFIGVAANYITVILTNSGGSQTVLTQGSGTTQYQIILNAPVQGAIWGVGGSITYNPSGSPIPAGSTLTIYRTLPLTQAITLSNLTSVSTLGKGAETGLDTGVMQGQQINEQISRAIVANITNSAPPLPLPPAAQIANLGACFDGTGLNMIGCSLAPSGIISSAMQPVVSAASLALGRAAFGLGSMAVENINGGTCGGASIQDDNSSGGANGVGYARVVPGTASDAISQTVTCAFHYTQRIATGPITYSLPRANTTFNGFGFWVYCFSGACTFTPNNNDSLVGQASGVSISIPPNSVAWISTNAQASGTWYVNWSPASIPLFQPTGEGGFSGLRIANDATTPNTVIDVTASSIVVGSAGITIRIPSPSWVINTANVGVLNGLDTGSLANTTWYYVHAVGCISLTGTVTSGGLISASATAPTLPSGCIYAKRLGAVRTDSSARFMRTLQQNRRVQYTLASGSNTTVLPIIATGTTSGYAAAPTGNFVPPTASVIYLSISTAVANTTIFVAPNPNYGTSSSASNPPWFSLFTPTGISGGASISMELESTNVYWSANGTTGIGVGGWEDNN